MTSIPSNLITRGAIQYCKNLSIRLFTALILFSPFMMLAQNEPPGCAVCGGSITIQDCETTGFVYSTMRNLVTNEMTLCVTSLFPSALGTFNWTVFQEVPSGFNMVASGTGSKTCMQITNASGNYWILNCYAAPNGYSYSCCQMFNIKPAAGDPQCCVLKYEFFTNIEDPTWDLGDGTNLLGNSFIHEYIDVNTYQVSTIPVKITAGNINPALLTLNQPIPAPPGIWVGEDCTQRSLANVVNRLDPALLIFPGNTVNGADISVRGALNTDKGFRFNNCDICMHPSASMINTTLSGAGVLQFTDLTTVHDLPCEDSHDAWYGIVNASGTAKRINVYESHFTGAYNALRLESSRSILRLRNSTFDRNLVGVYANNELSLPLFVGNTFGNTGAVMNWPEGGLGCGQNSMVRPANPLSEPYAGILMTNQQTLNMPFSSANNNFVNLANGIYLFDASADEILGCKFQHIFRGIYPAPSPANFDDGRGIVMVTTGNPPYILNQYGAGRDEMWTFKDCFTGIEINRQNNDYVNFFIRENGMTDVVQGVVISGLSSELKGTISQNDIYFKSLPPDSGLGIGISNATSSSNIIVQDNFAISGEDITVGINLSLINGTTGYVAQVLDNVIEEVTLGIGVNSSAFIRVSGNTISNDHSFGIATGSTLHSNISCNTVTTGGLSTASILGLFDNDNSFGANQTEGHAAGFLFRASTGNQNIACNTIGSHSDGLVVDNNGTIGDQGTPSSSNGNVWAGTYSAFEADAFDANPLNGTIFHTPSEAIGNDNPDGYMEIITSAIACETDCGDTPNNLTAGEGERNVAKSGGSQSGLMPYLQAQRLFRNLIVNPDYGQQDPWFDDFKTKYSNSVGGKLASLSVDMMAAFKLTSSQQSDFDAAIAAYKALYQDLRVAYDAIDAGTLDPQSIDIDAMEAELNRLRKAMQVIADENLTYRKSLALGFLSKLAGIPAIEVYQKNQQILLNLRLRTDYVGISISESDVLNVLYPMALQCEHIEGDAVLEARTWYNMLTRSNLGSPCNGLKLREAAQEELTISSLSSSLSVRIQPNPTKGMANLVFEQPLDSPTLVQIQDMKGVILAEKSLETGTQQTYLDFHLVPAGIYFCRITGGSKLPSVTKLVVKP